MTFLDVAVHLFLNHSLSLCNLDSLHSSRQMSALVPPSAHIVTVYLIVVGEEAKKLFDDAQRMLSSIVNEGLLHCAGVVGFWRANSVGDDIETYDENGCVVATLYGLRQQVAVIISIGETLRF